MDSGIYTITNLINSKLYVGYSITVPARRRCHIHDLKNNIHDNEKLQRAWNKYGEDNFLFEILEECEEQYLANQEHYWCNLLNVHDDRYGYNIQPTGPSSILRHSKESKEKMSIAIKATFKRIGYTCPYKNKKRSPEVGEKVSSSKKGKCAGVNKGIIRTTLRKAVIGYNIDGSLYKQFDCLKDVLLHFGKKPDSTSHLTRALKDSTKIVYNKFWKYENTDSR